MNQLELDYTVEMPRASMADRFRPYAVEATSVADFLDRYHKKNTYTGRGAEYAACVLASYEKELRERGFVITSHHDSITGEVVAFFGSGGLK